MSETVLRFMCKMIFELNLSKKLTQINIPYASNFLGENNLRIFQNLNLYKKKKRKRQWILKMIVTYRKKKIEYLCIWKCETYCELNMLSIPNWKVFWALKLVKRSHVQVEISITQITHKRRQVRWNSKYIFLNQLPSERLTEYWRRGGEGGRDQCCVDRKQFYRKSINFEFLKKKKKITLWLFQTVGSVEWV